MRRIGTMLGAILALHAAGAWAQGIAVRPRVMVGTTSDPITITVPVQVQNYPANLPSSGSPPLKVVCSILDSKTIVPQPVSSGSALVPFVPGPGNVNYQGSVNVALSVPAGTVLPRWQCELVMPEYPSNVRVDSANSVLKETALVTR
jgi:hypothetical protein